MVKSVHVAVLGPGVHFLRQIIPQDFEKWYLTAYLDGAQHEKVTTWNTSRQPCLCPWARHLTGGRRLYITLKRWIQAVYPSWWPNLTKDKRKDYRIMHELIQLLPQIITLEFNQP